VRLDTVVSHQEDAMAALKISLKARALRYLSAREHSRLELARKLSRHAQEGDDVEALLDALETAKLLSQSRFSESLVHRRTKRFGNNRILAELQSHGIDDNALTDIKADLDGNESVRASEVWRKKFGHLPVDAAERAKQMRFLQQRGFSHDAIQAVMRNVDQADD
jgi:regulatory protein